MSPSPQKVFIKKFPLKHLAKGIAPCSEIQREKNILSTKPHMELPMTNQQLLAISPRPMKNLLMPPKN